jgi:hypothetical protein
MPALKELLEREAVRLQRLVEEFKRQQAQKEGQA